MDRCSSSWVKFARVGTAPAMPGWCGYDPAVKEKTFTAQEITENGSLVRLRLLLHGTSTAETDYQVSGTVEVTIVD